jgi:hypothetical protein
MESEITWVLSRSLVVEIIATPEYFHSHWPIFQNVLAINLPDSIHTVYIDFEDIF